MEDREPLPGAAQGRERGGKGGAQSSGGVSVWPCWRAEQGRPQRQEPGEERRGGSTADNCARPRMGDGLPGKGTGHIGTGRAMLQPEGKPKMPLPRTLCLPPRPHRLAFAREE
mmetsp:Transcript_6677/g.16079  ORF Transcript_6677/g.16079 Transcript_6677/m.16079 type:complete len:113 (+) Transcript_6677:118-456(+)